MYCRILISCFTIGSLPKSPVVLKLVDFYAIPFIQKTTPESDSAVPAVSSYLHSGAAPNLRVGGCGQQWCCQ